MNNQLLTGALVRLAAQEPEQDARLFAQWSNDSEYQRLLEVRPVRPRAAQFFQQRLEREPERDFFPFAIHTLADNQVLGSVMLMHVNFTHGNCWVGIGIGNRADWGKGYGSDAMNVVLRFAFQELNMRRVSLDTLASNARAIRSYEKCGFVVEGHIRRAEQRDSQRDDLVVMGILREEWMRARH